MEDILIHIKKEDPINSFIILAMAAAETIMSPRLRVETALNIDGGIKLNLNSEAHLEPLANKFFRYFIFKYRKIHKFKMYL